MLANRIALGCSVLAIVICSWTIGSAAEEPGTRLYTAKCRRCHGEEGRGGQGPSLVPFKMSYEKALDLIRHPECEMPAFSESDLSDEQVAQIVNYLKTIKEP